MGKIVQVQLDDNTSFLVETRDDATGIAEQNRDRGVYRSARDTVEEAAQQGRTVVRALEMVAPVVQKVREAFVASSPDECQLEFGLKLSAGAGTIFTEIGAEAHVKVTLKWQAKPR